MRTTIKFTLAVALATAIAGCSAGRDFVRPDPRSLTLGKTTYHEILQRFGSPREEGSVAKNEAIVKTATYTYSSSAEKPLVEGVTPSRGLIFYFLDNDLVGYSFSSSFADDHTDFQESRVNRIKRGETTKSNLIELFGQPAGVRRYPLIKSKEDESFTWQYFQVKRSALSLKTHLKTLVVIVGTDNIVKEIEYSATGER